MDGSKIEWTDATWNPLRGCSRVSEGCRNCYAERVAARFSGTYVDSAGETQEKTGDPMAYSGIAEMTRKGPRWTGLVSLADHKMEDPLRWKRPRRIFVNSMSDLFHERVEVEWIDRIFKVMHAAPQHTFQVLTKRPKMMLDYMKSRYHYPNLTLDVKPPKNVWMGVSVEDQATADERIPLLLQTPAAIRWISYEPALGPVDLYKSRGLGNPFRQDLDWVVVGGESGPGARPFDVSWAHEIVKNCKAVGVPVFVKQIGAFVVTENANMFDFDESVPVMSTGEAEASARYMLRDKKGGDMAEWPEELRVREFPQ